MNDEHQQIEVVVGAAQRIIRSIQSAIFTSMASAAEGVAAQTKLAATFQRLESQEAILDWLVARRVAQEQKLAQSDLRPVQRAMIERKISQIDEELHALLATSGVESTIAASAVRTVAASPRIPKGENGGGRFLPKVANGHH